MQTGQNRRTRFRIAVLAAGRTPTQVAAGIGYCERHLDALLKSQRPLTPRVMEGLTAELGAAALGFIVGDSALVISPSTGK